MKLVINIFKLSLCFLLILNACKIDNYDGPNAKFSGSIKDEATGNLVGTDLQNGATIRAYERGWGARDALTWVIKPTGEFQNDMVFAARYDLEFINGNFYPFTVENFEIKKGQNRHDFEVTPYIRLRDVSITYDVNSNRVVATFKLQPGKPEVRVASIRLYGFEDIYVGEQVKYATSGSGFSSSFSPVKVIDDTETYTLYIDLNVAANANLFKYRMDGWNYYFRIGALASVSGVGTIRHNYSELVTIPSMNLK